MSTLLWLLLSFLYFGLFVTLALTTLRNGRGSVWVGIIFPVLWIVGAVMPPEGQSRARGTA
jgi:hypothetical protein